MVIFQSAMLNYQRVQQRIEKPVGSQAGSEGARAPRDWVGRGLTEAWFSGNLYNCIWYVYNIQYMYYIHICIFVIHIYIYIWYAVYLYGCMCIYIYNYIYSCIEPIEMIGMLMTHPTSHISMVFGALVTWPKGFSCNCTCQSKRFSISPRLGRGSACSPLFQVQNNLLLPH